MTLVAASLVGFSVGGWLALAGFWLAEGYNTRETIGILADYLSERQLYQQVVYLLKYRSVSVPLGLAVFGELLMVPSVVFLVIGALRANFGVWLSLCLLALGFVSIVSLGLMVYVRVFGDYGPKLSK